LPLELIQHELGRADKVPGSFPAHVLQIIFADHTPIHDPNPIGFAVFTFHHLKHLLGGGNLCSVAVKDFKGQRQSFLARYHADANLRTIRPTITTDPGQHNAKFLEERSVSRIQIWRP
jgi:hypothetical protein